MPKVYLNSSEIVIMKAVEENNKTGKKVVVSSIDSGEDRKFIFHDEDYCDEDEYKAFDGHIEAIVKENGRICDFRRGNGTKE